MLPAGLRKYTFARVARDYDEVRPTYPDDLIRAWALLAGISSESRVVEFGCGSGQLTKKLAPLGAEIDAVDMGQELVDIAKESLASYENVSLTCGSFEGFTDIPQSFDAIVVATAFHWFDPATRIERCARLLKPSGTLAIIQNIHRRDREHHPVRKAVNDVYERVIPREINDSFQGLNRRNNEVTEEIGRSELFGLLADRSFWHEHDLSTVDYLRLLNTFSFQHNLPDKVRRELFDGIKSVVDAHGGRIVSIYEAKLFVASRT